MNYKYQSTEKAIEAVQELQNVRQEIQEAILYDAQRYKEPEQMKRRNNYASKYADTWISANTAISNLEKDIESRKAEALNKALTDKGAEDDFRLLALPVTLSPNDLRVMLERSGSNMLFCRAVAEYADRHGYASERDLYRHSAGNDANSAAGRELCSWLRKVIDHGEDTARHITAQNIDDVVKARRSTRSARTQADVFTRLCTKGAFEAWEAET